MKIWNSFWQRQVAEFLGGTPKPHKRVQPRRSTERLGRFQRLGLEELETRRLLATTDTWTGGGTNNLWSNPNNWALNAVPSNGDDIVFSATATQTSVNFDSAANATYDSIVFNAAGYSLSGNGPGGSGLTLQNTGSGNGGLALVSNASGTDIINSTINLAATGLFVANTGANLVFNGPIAEGTNSLTFGSSAVVAGGGGNGGGSTGTNGGNYLANGIISGSGGLTMSGNGLLTVTAASTYTTTTTINSGTVNDQNATGLGAAANTTTVNAGTLQIQGGITVAQPLNLNGIGSGTGFGNGGAGKCHRRQYLFRRDHVAEHLVHRRGWWHVERYQRRWHQRRLRGQPDQGRARHANGHQRQCRLQWQRRSQQWHPELKRQRGWCGQRLRQFGHPAGR